MEQIRVVKELRDADRLRGRTGQLIRPRYMVWENVPGAFSSNGGEDFRAVLEETIRVACPDAPDIPFSRGGGVAPGGRLVRKRMVRCLPSFRCTVLGNAPAPP
nr:hypothetical protein [uncultured Dysosmobacter sp.]